MHIPESFLRGEQSNVRKENKESNKMQIIEGNYYN